MAMSPSHVCPLPRPCPHHVFVHLSCVPIMYPCHFCVPIPCPCLQCTSSVPSHARVPTTSPVCAMSLLSPSHTPVPIPITHLRPCCISVPVVHPRPHMTTSHDTSMSLLHARVPIPCLCARHMLWPHCMSVSLSHTQVPVASPCLRCTRTSPPHCRVPITPAAPPLRRTPPQPALPGEPPSLPRDGSGVPRGSLPGMGAATLVPALTWVPTPTSLWAAGGGRAGGTASP